MLRQLLLLPLLAPLLALLTVGAINPRPAVSLRLLIWSSPPLPIGVWIMLAAGGGGLLSAGATGLALRGAAGPGRGPGPSPASARQVRRPLEVEERGRDRSRWSEPTSGEPAWSTPPQPEAVGAGPSRAPGEPPPTLEVPFRVIRRASSTASTAAPNPAPTAASGVSAVPEGWDDDSDDW